MADNPEVAHDINPWLIAIAVMSSTFMEVLHTTVVNVSLPHIAGNLSATTDEATGTLTSYLRWDIDGRDRGVTQAAGACQRTGKICEPRESAGHGMIRRLQAGFLANGVDAATATKKAYAAVWGMVERQAAMLSYNDTFFMLVVMFVAMFPFILIVRKPKGGGPIMAH